jgi:MraZ protein
MVASARRVLQSGTEWGRVAHNGGQGHLSTLRAPGRADVLLGEFEQRLDDKNRVTLPAKVRESFADGVVCARGLDHCIAVWPKAAWEEYVSGLADRLDSFTPEGRGLQRYLYGGAHESELDRQGRVALTAPLIKHGSLAKEIVIAGLLDRLEIWDREAWRRQLAEVEGSAEVVAERLANAGR